MRVAAIGRTEILYRTIELLTEQGYEVPLIITCKEAPEYKIKAKDFEELASKIGAKYIYTPRLDTIEIVSLIKSIGIIDICISINFSGIISQQIVDLFELGILNAHAGDLPRYRGNACQAWAIIKGEEKIGLCVYKMVGDYLDGGKIISRKYYNVSNETTIGSVWSWMESLIPSMFIDSCKKLKKNPNFFIENTLESTIKPMRCYPRIPEDGRINWNSTNIEIIRLINASSEPYSGAFAYYNNKKLIIWKASLVHEDEEFLAIAGQVSAVNKDGTIDIITGTGKVRLIEIEYDGIRYIMPNKLIGSIRKRLS